MINYVLVYVFGIAFRYYSIKPMQSLSVDIGIKTALSLRPFQAGLCGWMAVVQLVLCPAETLRPNRATFWFLMQIGTGLGFATAHPGNWWLIKCGIK